MDAPDEELRLCHSCYQVQPLDAFRRRSKVGAARMYQCRDCHNEAERTRTIEKRAKHRQSEMFTFITQIKNARSPRRLETVVAAMIAACPSIEELALQFGATYRATQEKPTSKRALDCFQALIRLMEYLDAQRPRASELTDEELATCVAREMEDLIRRRPELAVDAAQRLGWTVVRSYFTSGVTLSDSISVAPGAILAHDAFQPPSTTGVSGGPSGTPGRLRRRLPTSVDLCEAPKHAAACNHSPFVIGRRRNAPRPAMRHQLGDTFR